MKKRPEYIQTDRGKFAVYRYSSENDDKHMVCLHGGPGFDSTYLIENLVPPLQELCHLIFIDLKGDGLSESMNSDQPYDLDDYAKDVAAVYQSLKLEKVDTSLYGHSFGGFVAIKTLAQYPDFFRKAILSNTETHFGYVSDFTPILEKLGISNDVNVLEQKLVSGEGTDADFYKMNLLYAKLYYPDFSQIEAEKLIDKGKFTACPYVNFLKHILPSMDLRDDCKKIKAQTLILGSELDYITPWVAQKDLEALIPKSNSFCFPDTGHFPFVKDQEAYSKIIKKWI